MTSVGLLLLLGSLALMLAVGVAFGREVERHKPVLDFAEVQARQQAYESELRGKLRLRRIHPDPENAARQYKARMHR